MISNSSWSTLFPKEFIFVSHFEFMKINEIIVIIKLVGEKIKEMCKDNNWNNILKL